jgi:hypothetical protein
MADKGIPFDVPTRANLLQGQRLIDEQLREKAARDAKLSPLDKAYAALEAARTFGSGILATVGSLPTRAIKGEDAAQEYINQRMYIPTTEKGMDYVGNVGNFLEQLETKYKLPPVLPEAVALQQVAGPAAKQATKQAAKAAKPVVGKALEDYMFKQGLALPATVYHGSPHKFDKFDASKIGTGEGAQAYGHGLYLAESPDVAKRYQPRDREFENVLMQKYSQAEKAGDYASMQIYEDFLTHKSPNEIRDALPELGFTGKDLVNAQKALDFATKQYQKQTAGGLYKVDLPDEQIAKMLDWDKPLSQQAPEVQAALSKTPLPPETTGAEAYEWLQQIGGGTKEKSQAFASRHLLEQGIPGIRYLDADSRAAGKGTSNFVVFPGEEDALTILERNQQPIKKESTRIADNPDTMMMEVEDQKFVGGGIAKAAKTAAKSAVATRELEKQAVLRAEAAAKSAAKQALMPQYNEAVKGMTQKQKPLSFEQWKAINYPEGTQGLQNAPQKQTFKYPQEEAMRLAQQRAALPIEQGGLGLPANNTPEQRAKAMGISTDAYHGTKQDITGAFKPGYDDNLAFVTKSPEFASKWIGKGKLQQRSGEQAQQEVKSAEDAYREIKLRNMKYDDALNDLKGEEFNTEYDRRSALARAEAEAEFGSRGSPDAIHSTVYPLKVEANRTFNPETDMDVMAEFFEKNEIPPKVQDLYASGNYMMYETKPVVAYLKSKGYDSMRLRESTGDDYPTIAVFNPETTRSRFAAFDPFRKDVATAAAMGVAAPNLLAEENKASGGSVNLDAMYMAVNDAKFRRK